MSSIIRRAGTFKNVAVKPIMSTSAVEARRRVLTHYKQWMRAVPKIIHCFELPYTERQVRAKLREQFLKNSHIRDIRAVDMLVIKGEMDLQETLLQWKQECHVRQYFEFETQIKEPTDFLGKFFARK